MGLNRRFFLVSLGSSGVLVACGGGGGTNPIPSGGGTPTPKPTGSATPTPTASPTASPTPSPAGTLVFDLTKTDLPAGTQVYAYIVGQQGASSAYYWFNPSTSAFQQMAGGDNAYSSTTYPASMSGVTAYQSQLQLSYQSAWADYSIPLTVGQRTSIDLWSAVNGHIPGLSTGTAALGGRIYLSVGPLKLPITGDPTSPTLPVVVQGPGMYSLFDWMEFSVDSSGTLYLNTTQVDQFGFQLIGSVGSASVSPNPIGGLSGTRESLISQVGTTMGNLFGTNTMNLPAYGGYTYSTSVFEMSVPAIGAGTLYPSGINHLRAVAPKNFCIGISGYTPASAITTYFDNYVRQCFSYWQSNVMSTTDTADGQYSGYVPTTGPNAGSLVFLQGNYTSVASMQTAIAGGVAPAFTLAPPPTNDIWECANSLATGTSQQKDMQKIIAAAFNRGLVATNMNDTSTSVPGAYTAANPLGAGVTPVWNQWAQAWHQFSVDGFAYGFAYDDVNSQAAVFHETGWASGDYATITLGTFFASHLTSARRIGMTRREMLLRA